MEGEIKVNILTSFLRKELILKIIAVLVGVFLWFFVLNSENPLDQKSIPIKINELNIDALEKNGLLKKKDISSSYITVNILARKDKLREINESDFIVNVDYSKVDSVSDKSISIDEPKYTGKFKNGDFMISYSPKKVNIELESFKTNPFKVQIIPEGQMKSNYKIIKMISDPEEVSIVALGSQLKQISAVKVFIDVSTLNKNTIVKKQCRIYDINGNEIKDLKQNIEVSAKLFIGKEIPVIPVFSGAIDNNYILSSTKVVPDKLILTGDSEILDTTEQIKTEDVDLSKSTSDIYVNKKIILPSKLKLVDDINSVAISALIEQVFKNSFYINGSNITVVNMSGYANYNYEVLTTGINIELKGLKKEIDGLSTANLEPMVDVTGLTEGKYKLPLKLKLSANMSTTTTYYIDVRITKK
jgi:YbbR domain-containing protein